MTSPPRGAIGASPHARTGADRGRRPGSPARRASPSERIPWLHVGAFVAGAILVLLFTAHQIGAERETVLAHWKSRLATVTGDRARLVSGWLAARRADADVLAAFPAVRTLLAGHGRDEEALAQHLARVASAYGYVAIAVCDPQGHLVARSGTAGAGAGRLAEQAPRHAALVARSGQPRVELSGDAAGRLLVITVPVFSDGAPAEREGDGRTVVGTVTLGARPEAGLYPLLTDDADPARTSETLLVDLAVEPPAFLSPLRHPVAPAAETPRRSLAALRDLARAAGEGREPVGEVVDYRGVPVLAVARQITPTGWTLSLKVDRDEALVEFHRSRQLAGAAAASLLLALAGFFIALHREQQRARLLQEQVRQARAMSDLQGFGQPVTLRGLTVDLTELRRSERALRQSEEQLRQAQKMDAVGKLAGGIAHDFNNLLMVIRGDSDLMLRRLAPGHPLRRNAEGIREAADQAATLTRQLLAFSRKQVMAPRLVDLNAIVASIHAMLQRLLGETINLVTITAPDLGGITADPGQMEQMILNLCVNARDAMPDGGRLTIRTANVELDAAAVARWSDVKTGPYVMLEVADTGIGMDPETRSHLFEPFFTTKEQGKGTGLGLSTVYGTVKQSGGHISVESEPGRGSTFTMYLPRVAAAAALPEARPVPAGPARRPRAEARLTPGRGETILLVEDAQRVRAVVREILEMSGYVVLEARHGAEALELSNRHSGVIHLLVTDVVMPQMSGRELAQRLATLRPELKVLYMSGYTDDAIVRHGVLASGIAFLSKPFTPDALALKVREVLDGVSDGAAAGAAAPGGTDRPRS